MKPIRRYRLIFRINFFPADADEAEQERKQADQGQNGRGGQKKIRQNKALPFCSEKNRKS